MDWLTILHHNQLSGSYEREDCPVASDHWLHFHTQFELLYIMEGKGTFRVEGTVYPIRAGDLFLTRTAEAHMAQPDPDTPYERLSVNFSPDMVRELLSGRLLAPFLNRPLGTLNHYAAEELPAEFFRLCAERMFLHGNAHSQMRAATYLLPLLQEVYDIWAAKRETLQPDEPSSLPTRLVAYINQNLSALQSPKQLEKQFFLSQSHLNRVFREFTGTSIWEYVRTKRLFAARELLQAGIRPQQAAAECGYQDYSTFYRAYKKHFGCSPQEERR